MRILTISTSERIGGGAIAASRLNDALCRNGMKARMLVRDKQTDAVTVAQTGNIWPKIAERLDVWMHNGFSRKRLWLADTACCGVDILGTREYQEADVVHLHWVNQGMLSISTLERMVEEEKPLVWTLHDEWPFLGVCHYRGACQETECRRCPLMRGGLPHRLLKRKHELLQRANITLVGCSQWITDRAREALPGVRVQHINNCIPHALYHPIPQQEARQQWNLPQQAHILLFCSQKVTDQRKGMTYLLEALGQLHVEDLHLVDDRATAEQVVRSCIYKGYGIQRAKQALYEKQIPKAYWDEALEDYPDQSEKIQEFLRARLDTDSDEKQKKRAIDALIRRGHSYGVIKKALESLSFDTEDMFED